jgi:hypothetical protein
VQGFNIRAYLMTKSIEPQTQVSEYKFNYYLNPETNQTALSSNMNVTEATIEARVGFKETYIINGNRRASIGFDRAPILTLTYSRGLTGFLNGQFRYNKLIFTIDQSAKMGTFGHCDYSLSASKIFERLPYPLLSIAPGNQTILRTYGTFNMMNFFEFVTDQSVTAIYTQHFDGLFFNRVPLFNRLKWREVIGAKALWGSLSPQNSLRSNLYPQDESLTPFYTLDPKLPYMEVSYGVENIFRFFRVDFIQRLNYLHTGSGAPQFAVKGSFYFAF